MKGIRRSLNKDRIGAPTPTFSTLSTSSYPSIPAPAKAPLPISTQRPTAAPAPPKRVIRAITSYRARSNQELTFDQGDFFHVVSDDGGDDWFDAANPMTGARGLVPASCFQVLGRNVRETAQGVGAAAGRKNTNGGPSGGPSPSGSSSGRQGQPSPSYGGPSMSQQQQSQQPNYPQQHDSGRGGYSNGGGQQGHVPTSNAPMQSTFISPPTSPPLGSTGQHLSTSSAGSKTSSGGNRPPSQPTPKSQPLYGIVQYDFVAERADELNAKRGEPIIVIAQSNHEWFVAKPIGRLGGPGLIPVAFVEIQDMTTGKPVENVEELIRSAVVPKVEEWKKMTADYKSASIPLGRFDFADGAAPPSSTSNANVPKAAFTGASSQPPASSSREPQYDVGGSNGTVRQDGGGYQQQQQYDQQQPQDNYYDDGDQPAYDFAAARRQYGLVTSASVESFHQEEGSFWFHVRAYFSTGASLVLYRLYQDFYDFQIALMDEFPVEAGRVPPGGEGSGRPLERILPMMPGPTDYEDENVCSSRVQDLSTYLADLCALPEHLRAAGLMYEFFIPRAGDVEVATGNGLGDTPGGGRDDRQPSIDGQYGELVEYLDSMEGQDKRGNSGEIPDVGGLNLNGGQEEDFDTYRPQAQSQGRQSGGSKTSSTRHSNSRSSNPYGEDQYRAPSQQQSYQNTYPSPPTTSNSQQQSSNNSNLPFVKIKIFHRNTDDLIAIRVPPNVTHASLLEKVRERLGGDVVNLRYREEVGSAGGPAGGGQVVMAGGARLIGVDSDQDLERWIRGGSRLVLYAD